MVSITALLVDSGQKNNAKAHLVDLLNIMLPAMLDLSHINAWKEQNAAIKEGLGPYVGGTKN